MAAQAAADKQAGKSADYIVIGAGSAGCVVAARLSEDRDVSVLLLEAGPRDDCLLGVPGALIRSSTVAKFNWSFWSEAEAALDGRKLFWSQGRVLGGSSSINGMVYTRGTRDDYNAWVGRGCAGWSFEDVLPFFKKSETNERGASYWHGAAGPMQVTRGNPQLGIMDALLAAAANRGYRIVDDFNAGDPEGFGHYDRTIGAGRRSSSARAFLLPAAARANLEWSTDTLVERVVIENGRATGVWYVQAGVRKRVWANREVILCAGALKSPHLLMLSGIGPADQLHRFQVPVHLDAPGVGQNLGNHLLYTLQYHCCRPITAYAHATPFGVAKAIARYAVTRGGFLSQTPISSGGFLRSSSLVAVPDIQVQAVTGLAGQVGQSIWSRLPKRHGFALMVNHSRPRSRGEIRLQSSDPSVAPLIYPRHLSAPEDSRVLVDGVERVREILADPALDQTIEKELNPGTGASRADILTDIRRRAIQAFHGVGTCRMGVDFEAVVDAQLRVRGIGGLRVADASIIPTVIGANTNAPAIMIGERCADFIRRI